MTAYRQTFQEIQAGQKVGILVVPQQHQPKALRNIFVHIQDTAVHCNIPCQEFPLLLLG